MRYAKALQKQKKLRQARQIAGEALILISIGVIWAGLFVWGFFEVIA